jgi:hypothetical protein
MIQILLIARRETLMNRQVLLVALIIGLFPVIIPFMPGLESWPVSYIRSTSAVFCASSLALLLSLAFGWSTFGRDLSENRLSFYFSRPVASFAIWGGRCLGAQLVILASAFLTLAPAALMDRGVRDSIQELFRPYSVWGLLSPLGKPLLFAAVCLGLFAVAHVLGVIYRTRLLAAAAHFPLLLLAVAWATVTARRMSGEGAINGMTRGLWALGFLAIISFWITLAFQLSRGRASLHRGHKIVLMVLWPALFGNLLAFDAYSRWFLNVDIQNLQYMSVTAGSGRGPWILLSGVGKNRGDYLSSFLFNTVSKKSIIIRSLRGSGGNTMSKDGRLAAWLIFEPGQSLTRLYTAKLDEDPVKIQSAGVVVKGDAWMQFSEDGSMLGLFEPGFVTAYKLSGGLLQSGVTIPCPGWEIDRAQFISGNRMRIYARAASQFQANSKKYQIAELHFETRSRTVTGEIDSARSIILSPPEYSRILAVRDEQLSVCDARSGIEITRFDAALVHQKGFLSDGRILLVESTEGDYQFRLFDPDGKKEKIIRIPAGMVGAEWNHGHELIFSARGPRNSGNERKLLLQRVNLEDGKITPIAPGLFPVHAWDQNGWSVGSPFTRLYQSKSSLLLDFDPATGSSRELIRGAGHAGFLF